MHRTNALIIGIAGGIASGKSFVTEQLERHGAAVISADTAAHEVLKLEEVKDLARKRWGNAIFAADGQIDRTALGEIVFAPPPDGPRERKYLEQLTHPRIREIINRQAGELAQQGSATAVVLDLPLLFESGWNKFCDKIVFVDAPREVRQSRAAQRGWTPEEFTRRETAQQSPEAKRELADVVIDNSGSRESARAQVDRFWQSLVDTSVPP
jgi:dephospho-CoA kinase